MKSHLFPLHFLSAHSLAALVAFLMGGLSVAAESRPANDDIIAIIRAPAPKLLLPKVMDIARQIQPGPQTEALPFILGGMLGDPMLTGISATENFGLVLVAGGDLAVAPVLMLKLTEDSPLRASLGRFDMESKDSGEWTFASPQGGLLSLVEGREEAVIAAMTGQRRYDLEVAIRPAFFLDKIQEFLPALGIADGTGRSAFDAFVKEAESVRDVRIGFNMSHDEIELVYYLQAAPGSAMAAFLDQKRPVDLGFARYIASDGAIGFLGGIDVGASRIYLNHLIGRLPENGLDELRGLAGLAVSYLDATDGASGGTVSLDGFVPRMTSVTPYSGTEEEFLSMIQEMTGAMTLTAGMAEGAVPAYSVVENHLRINGVPVHLMKVEVGLSAEEREAMAEISGFAMPESQEVYYALVDGYAISASDSERLMKTLQAVQKREPVENSLASRISLREESLFEFQMDPFEYLGGIMTAMMPFELGDWFEQMQSHNLPPVKGSLSARGGEAEMRISIPVKTIVIAYQAFGAFTAQQGTAPAQP